MIGGNGFLLLFLGCLIALSFIFFQLNGRKLYSPSFLLCAIFAMCGVFALIGNALYWHEIISWKAPTIIILGLAFIGALEYAVGLLLRRFHTRGKSRPKEELLYPEHLSKAGLCIIGIATIMGLLANGIYLKYSLDAAIRYGYQPYSLSFMAFLRKAVLAGEPFPTWVTLLNFAVRGFGLASIYWAVFFFFDPQHRKRCLLFFGGVLNLLVSFFLTTARDVFILVAVVFLFSLLVIVDKRKVKIRPVRILLVGFGLLIGFFSIYFVSGFSRNNTAVSLNHYLSSFLNIVCRYGGSSIIAFDKWLRLEPAWPINSPFGSESFSGIYYFLNRVFHAQLPEGTTLLEYVHFADGGETNIYTMFRSFIADFGIFGEIVVVFGIGVAYGLIAFYARKEKTSSPFLLYSGLTVFYLLYGAFTPTVTTSLFGAHRIAFVVFGLFSFVLIRRSLLPHAAKLTPSEKRSEKPSFRKNVSFALIAEIVAIFTGAAASLLIPKYVGDEAYGYYTLFTFYAGYVGLAHLGYCDGVYLRFGGKTSSDFKKSNIKTQFLLFSIVELLFSVAVVLYSFSLTSSSLERALVLLCVGIHLFIYNHFIFLGYIFQDINETSIYSKGTIIAKAFFLVSLFGLFFFRVKTPFAFIGCFIGGYTLALVYLVVKGKAFLFGRPGLFRQAIKDMGASLKSGIVLLLAGLLNALILGGARYIIDWRWGITTFGKLSLAISLVSLIGAFFISFSLVLFPSLRLRNSESIESFFTKSATILSVVLPLAYLAFFALHLFVAWWLPSYEQSLTFFAIALPSVIFNAKYAILNRTAMNVDQRTKRLFLTNLIAALVSILFALASAFLFNSVEATVLASVFGSATLSILGQFLSGRGNKAHIIKSSVSDVLLGGGFILTNWLIGPDFLWVKALITLGLLSVYYLIFRKETRNVVAAFSAAIKKKKEKKGQRTPSDTNN